MIGLLVLALMAWNFYIGYRRGLYASLLRGFSHYRHVRRGLFL